MTPSRDDLDARVDAYLHGLLEPTEATELEEQCATSEEWRRALERGRRRLAALESVPAHEPSETLIRDTLHAVEQGEALSRRRRRAVLFGLGFANVAAAVVLGIVNLYYLRMSPRPA